MLHNSIDMSILHFSLNQQILVMVNDFNSFYMLAICRWNMYYIQVKFFFNFIDTPDVVNKGNFFNKLFRNKDIKEY